MMVRSEWGGGGSRFKRGPLVQRLVSIIEPDHNFNAGWPCSTQTHTLSVCA